MQSSSNPTTLLSNASLALGVLSIFLWEFSIFPLGAIICGIAGIYTKESDTPVAKAVFGIILGAIFLVVRVAHL